MKSLNTIFAVALASASIMACSRVDEPLSKIDDFSAEAAKINGNVAVMQSLAHSEVINSVSESVSAYNILLANGTELTLNNEVNAYSPVVSVENGFWTVNGDVLTAGESEVAVDALPVFAVNAAGKWTVRVSGNENVLCDAVAGEKTVAFFENIENTETKFAARKGASVLSAPVAAGFLFKINADGAQKFVLGQTREYDITKSGVSAATVVAPQGWEVSLSDTKISITAPHTPLTKAVIADSKTDVSVIAVSTSGYVTIAKVVTDLDETISATDPFAMLEAGEVKAFSATVNVALQNTTAWYYLLKKSSEAAPSADEIKAANTGNGTSVTLTTEPETAYTLYVLPVKDEAAGAVAKINFTTTEIASYYEAYEAGAELKIGSQTFSKAKNGNANLVTAQNQNIYGAWVNNGNFGIFFIEDGASAVLNSGFNKSVIIVGNKPGTRPTVDVSAQITVAGAETDLVLKNVSLTMDNAANGNIRITNSTEIRRVILEDCYIDLKTPFMQRFYTDVEKNGKLTGLEMIGCDVCVNWRSDCNQFHFVMMQVGGAECGDVTIMNNVFWSKDGKKEFHIFGTNYSGTAKMNNVAVENNTFYNVNNGLCSSGRSKALIMATTVDSYSFSANIAYDSSPVDKTDPNRPHFAWLYTKSMTMDEVKAVMTSVQKSPMNIPEYCSYTTSNGSEWSQGIQNLITWKPGGSSAVDTWANPFKTENVEAGLFETKSDYSSFGAQRK